LPELGGSIGELENLLIQAAKKAPHLHEIIIPAAYFPIGTDFRLTILFHLMKCRPRCFDTLHSRHSNAASQQAPLGPWCFWNNQFGKKRNSACLFGRILLEMLRVSGLALFLQPRGRGLPGIVSILENLSLGILSAFGQGVSEVKVTVHKQVF
jgi:hypothetical protein